jgi:hypothetical protein
MRLNKLQITEVCDQYQSGVSVCHLSKTYSISETAICGLLQRRGIQRRAAYDPIHRKHTLNEHAFDSITEESAYWIGFLMADGTIVERSANSFQLSLSLQDRDRAHLECFKRFLGSSHAITTITAPTYTSCYLSIRSKKLADALAQYGVIPGKTHTAQVIGLEKNRHFWRGVVDGDGYIALLNNKARLELVGSQMLLKQFLAYIGSFYPTHQLTIRPHKSIYKVATNGPVAYSLIKELYDPCEIALARKLETSSNILNAALNIRALGLQGLGLSREAPALESGE